MTKKCKITRSEFSKIIENTEKKLGSRLSQSDIRNDYERYD